MSLLSGKRVINITDIIQVEFVERYSTISFVTVLSATE